MLSSLQYALLAGAAVLIGCCRGQGPSPVVTDPTTEPATNTTIPSEEQAIIVVMALIGVAVIIIAISLSAAVIVIKNKPHKSNKTRPQVEEGQHQMTEMNGGMIEESISVASSDQMTPPAAPHTASHKHHHRKHRHRHRQRERQQHQQQEGSPDQNEQEQDHDTQEEQEQQQVCTVALDGDDTRQQQPLAVQQQHQPEPMDHDAAASTQDQYLSEDSDDNMDVIMEEPILEEEEDVDKARFTRSYDIIEEMTGPRQANLDSAAAAAAGLSSWVNIDGAALLEKIAQQQQQQQESLLTSTSTVASSESGFVVVDPSLATALAQDKKDKKQLLLAKTMAGDRS